MTQFPQKKLVLGSSSPYRKTLLERLKLEFITESPDIEEDQLSDETPEEFVLRLSLEKAKAIAQNHKDALIIGSDQCSILDGAIRGKPGSHENAVKQLSESSGKRVSFLTGLCLYDSTEGTYQLDVVPFHVDFRILDNEEIERYLAADKPYNCAGSFKSEGLGVSLFKRMQGDDPSTLIGLPLIRLSEMLRKKGVKLP